MDRILLERAARVLANTDYSQVTGKAATADNILHSLRSIFNSETEAITDKPAMDFYKGFTEIVQPLAKNGEPLERMLEYAFCQLMAMLSSQPMTRQNWVSAYVLGTLSAIKAVLDCIESREKSGIIDSEARIVKDVGKMSELINILESIDWEMSKADIKRVFRYMESIGSHPTQNAIGFSTEIQNIQTAVVCYFHRKIFSERLGAINIVIYQEPPPVQELKKHFDEVIYDISARYGNPRIRKNDYVAWVSSGRVIIASTATGLLGIRYGDPKIDLPSKIVIGTKE